MRDPAHQDPNIQRSLSLKIVGWALALTLISTLGLTCWETWRSRGVEKAHLNDLIEQVVQSRHEAISSAVGVGYSEGINAELSSLARLKDVDFVTLTTSNGQVFAAGDDPSEKRVFREFEIKTADQSQVIGRIVFKSGMKAANAALRERMFLVLLQEFSLCSLIGLALFLYMQVTFVRPLTQVTRYLMGLRPDGENPRLHISRLRIIRGSYDELDALADHINALKERVLLSHFALKEANTHLEARVEERTALILEQRHRLEASARWSALGEMAGSIAHEINNPLAVIMGKAQLLQRRNNPEYTQAGLEMIIRTTERIASIIQSLRVLSRDASSDPFEYVPISQVVHDALGLSEERLRNLKIQLDVDGSIDRWEIYCRRVQISQILVNLINNSIDALDGSKSRWIRLNVFPSEGQLLFTLSDSGPGIPHEIRAKIMTPFFTTKEVGKGTGLGLSLSRSIMNAHKGSLEIDFAAPHTTVQLAFREFRAVAAREKRSG